MDRSNDGAGFPAWAVVLIFSLFCAPVGMQLLGFGTTVAVDAGSVASNPGVLTIEQTLPPVPSSGAPVIPHPDASAELAAQQWMALASFWTMLLSAVGVILIGGTLIATRQTLREAERATAAALDAVAVTREIGEAQTSPFLMVMPGGKLWVQLKDGRLNCVLKLSIKNVGHTATRGAALTFQIFPTRNSAITTLTHNGRLRFRAVSSLGPMEPGGIFELDDHFETPVEAVASLMKENNPEAGEFKAAIFIVWASLVWTDYADRGSKPQQVSLRTTAPLRLDLTTSGDLPLSYPNLRGHELLT